MASSGHRLSFYDAAQLNIESMEMIGKEPEADDVDTEQKSKALFARLKVLRAFGAFKKATTIERLPDKALMQIFSYLTHKEVLSCARVCRKWRTIAYDSRLWQVVSLRGDYDGGLQVNSLEALLALISVRFGPSLRLIELPMDLILAPVLHELANKCPKLQFLTLDFSNAMQLHDFNDLVSFPARLRSLTICLSEVIFLEGFMRKIYNYISSLEILHLIGTYEKIEDTEEEVYEVINIHKLKVHTPNLRVVNLFGVTFVSDDHIDSLSQTCVNLECLSISFCEKFTGMALKVLIQRCKRLRTLLMEQTGLKNQHVMNVDWEKSLIQELNISETSLNAECLTSLLTRLPNLRWLSAAFQEYFTDQVLETWLNSGAANTLQALDLSTCDALGDSALTSFMNRLGPQLQGLILGGIPHLAEHFWMSTCPKLKNIRILGMGTADDCCTKVISRIHVDQFLSVIGDNCSRLERLEVRWDPETIRFSDRSSKFIDILRMKCLRLRSLTLSDGPYYELVKSNFERTGRMSVVRTTTMCRTTLMPLLFQYSELLFN